MKRPAHGAFSGKSDSSGSSFAKLCGGGFRVRSGISSQKIRTFFKKIKNFQKKITAFLKKNKSFFKNVLIFLLLPIHRKTVHSVEVQTFHVYFLWGKSLKYPTLYQAETIYKKEYIAENKDVM